MIKWGLLFAFILGPQIALSHIRLTYPTPRSNNSGIKSAPCGGLPAGTPLTLTAGSSLTVQWEETINHPGRYILSFSPGNDQGFTPLTTIVDTKDDTVLPHKYSATVTVPNTLCDRCTLQLIQSMEEVPTAPTYYYSCADIKIVPPAQMPSPSPNPNPPPAPNPNPNPPPSPVPVPGPLPNPPPAPPPSPAPLPGDVGSQSVIPSSKMERTYPEFKSGCAMIKAEADRDSDLMVGLLLLAPLGLWSLLRARRERSNSSPVSPAI